MYVACKQMFDTVSMKIRQNDQPVSRLLLARLTNCAATTPECPYRTECRNMSVRFTEIVDSTRAA